MLSPLQMIQTYEPTGGGPQAPVVMEDLAYKLKVGLRSRLVPISTTQFGMLERISRVLFSGGFHALVEPPTSGAHSSWHLRAW